MKTIENMSNNIRERKNGKELGVGVQGTGDPLQVSGDLWPECRKITFNTCRSRRLAIGRVQELSCQTLPRSGAFQKRNRTCIHVLSVKAAKKKKKKRLFYLKYHFDGLRNLVPKQANQDHRPEKVAQQFFQVVQNVADTTRSLALSS